MGRIIESPQAAIEIISRLRNAGHEALLCGGCVRDALMGRPPKDFDITTSATPDEVEELFEKTVPVGKAFGVMIVVMDDENYEVATFRTDMNYADGRRPEGVEFTTAEEDVKRRDFTINALLYDPVADEVVDYVGGVRDLEKGILRTVGDPRKRFEEDHLRLLRAVRFAARTGFIIEEHTRAAIKEMAPLVKTVSGERTGEEIRRMLTEGYARRAFEMLEETGLILHVLPEVAVMRGMPQPIQFHPEGCVLEHTYIMLGMLDESINSAKSGNGSIEEALTLPEGSDPFFAIEVLAFATLLHDVGKPPSITHTDRIRFHEHDRIGASLSVEIIDRLKRPRKVADSVRELIGRHMHFAALPQMRRSKKRRLLQDPLFPLHLALHRMDCASSHGIMTTYDYGVAALAEERTLPPVVEPLLTGRDLIELGYRPGPPMGRMLREVEDMRLEGEIETREEAFKHISDNYPLQ